MKLQTIALFSILSAVTAGAHAEDRELVDCFYESNQSHPACTVDTTAESESVSNLNQLAAVGRVRNPEELVDCFYEYNRYSAACQ